MIDSQLYRWWMFMVSLNVGTLLNAIDFRRRSGQSFLMFLGNDLVEAQGLALFGLLLLFLLALGLVVFSIISGL
jgi:hypothetical protein